MNIIGQRVICRGVNSGVHFGIVLAWQGTTVMLGTARNVGNWEGANTLHEMSMDGISSGFVSKAVEKMIQLDVCQIEFLTDKAWNVLTRIGG